MDESERARLVVGGIYSFDTEAAAGLKMEGRVPYARSVFSSTQTMLSLKPLTHV